MTERIRYQRSPSLGSIPFCINYQGFWYGRRKLLFDLRFNAKGINVNNGTKRHMGEKVLLYNLLVELKGIQKLRNAASVFKRLLGLTHSDPM